MIDRFNFYDIYGYVLPGLAALGVGWFPFWFLATRDLPAGWSSALVGVVIAYLLGHVLKPLGTSALWRDEPSVAMLDDATFPNEMRVLLLAVIHRRLGIQVGAAPADDPAEKARRQAAFFACRSALIQSEAVSYAEQFEALYVACRGVAFAAILAVPYWWGWMIGRYSPDAAGVGAPLFTGLLVGAAVIVSVVPRLRQRDNRPPKMSKTLPWLTAALLVPAGAALGAQSTTIRDTAGLVTLGTASVAALFFASRFYEAYREFARLFVKTVYQDFYVQSRTVAEQ
jgi:hypothetical protein